MKVLTLIANFFSLMAICCSTVHASFSIEIKYTGGATNQSLFDDSETAFNDAAATWESLISGYRDGVVASPQTGASYNVGDMVDTLFIDVTILSVDGVGGALASGGVRKNVVDTSGFRLSTDGRVRLDADDLPGLINNNPGKLRTVLLHEIGHAMGFGTLWKQNGVYIKDSGEFTGTHATSIWQSEFGQSGTPDVELSGTQKNNHWNENPGGKGLTGIVDSLGRDMRDEVMTGWSVSNSFVSDLTLGSFVDIGYTSHAVAVVVPEPNSLIALAIAGGWLATLRRRR